jgi:hypothetical protein
MNTKFIVVLLCAISINLFAKKERPSYLTKLTEQKNIKELISYDKSWIKFPTYYERDKWNALPKHIRKDYIKKGEKYLDYNWPSIKLSTYQDFIRTGSREAQQKPYGERRKALESLFFAEMVEGKGRFMDQLINGVWAVCEQTYWGISAHLTLQKAGAGVPDISDPTIDLAAGMLGANMSWIHYFLHKEFDKFNPLVSKRMEYEIKRQIIEPYYKRTDFWWQAFGREFVNNWNPWCNYNSLLCAMLIEKDKEKVAYIAEKTMKSVDFFINYYHHDGGCEEGPAYWGHAGGKLFSYLDLLSDITKDQINIFDKPLVKNIGTYIYKAYISGSYFINFADASYKINPDARIVYSYGKRVNDPTMMQFGAYLAQRGNFDKKAYTGKIEKSLKNIFIAKELMEANAHEPLLADFWLSGTELAGARDQEGSNKGFYFAAKGGYNQESHNHNDVGTFVLYYNGEPCFVDAGVGTYTRKTFSPQRYDIWTMRSEYHNLPVINGVQQKNGQKYKAKECFFRNDKDETQFSVDITDAYPKEAQVKFWKRTYELEKGECFTIRDKFSLKKYKGANELKFLTICDVEKIDDGELKLKGKGFELTMNYDEDDFDFAIERVKLEDKKLIRAWNNKIFRITLKSKNKDLKGQYKIEIEN